MKLLKALFTLSLVLVFTSCKDKDISYDKDDVSLQVAARDAILGLQSNRFDEVLLLENDNFGRTMIAYKGKNTLIEYYGVIAVVIIQKNTDEVTYVYDGINFLYKPLGEDYLELNTSNVNQSFSSDSIDALKEANDWNKPLKTDRFFTISVNNSKPSAVPLNQLRSVAGELSSNIRLAGIRLLSIDRNGLKVYLMRGYVYNKKSDITLWGPTYLVMFDQENNIVKDTGIQLILEEQLNNYYDILLDFKRINGWAFY